MRNQLLKVSFILGILAGSITVHGQSYNSYGSKPVVKKAKPIRKEFSVGFRLNTDGWSLFADKGYVKTNETKLRDQFHNVRIFQLELSEHKDPKEIKRGVTDATPNGGTQKSKAFIYGKINNFYSLRLGYGMRKLIAGKPEPGTVSIHLVLAGGFALGMEKPYYIDGYIPQDNTGSLVPATFKYSEDTKQSFLEESYIRGGAGFSTGIGETQFIPGIHAKTALHFDFAGDKRTVLAVETGVNAEYYSRAIQIMANQEAKPYLINLFASFQFGRRK